MDFTLKFPNQRLEQIVEQLKPIEPDVRRWTSMPEYFREQPEPETDPVIYELYALPYTSSPTDLMVVLTVLHAGTLGSEHFHTKGHFHQDPDGAEYVITLAGEGMLERGTRTGLVTNSTMEAGTHLIVPPGQAHRAVNTGDRPLVFLSLCSPIVGHDYISVQHLGWAKMSES